MDLRILRYFLAVAEEGNITRASERLHISQPALSTQLAALEDELGQRLFERGARGIELTEKGIALKRRADDLVDLAERIEAEIKSKDGGELVGTLSIGAGETPAFRFVARAAEGLRCENPRLNFSISSGNGEDIIAHLQEGTFDLGVLVGPGRYEGFNYLSLPYTHRWGLAVEKDSPLAAKSKITLEDLKPYPRLSYEQGSHNSFYFSEEILSTVDCDKEIIVLDRATLFNMLIGLNGYTICSGIISEELNGPSIIARPLDVDDYMEVGYILPISIHPSHLTAQYIEILGNLTRG